mgnify:CR=1 FL=1
MSEPTHSFLSKNWHILLWVVSAIFIAGGFFAEFQYLQSEIETLNQRLNKKIDVINSLDNRVEKTEHYIEYEKGYKDANSRK